MRVFRRGIIKCTATVITLPLGLEAGRGVGLAQHLLCGLRDYGDSAFNWITVTVHLIITGLAVARDPCGN